ncbi:hypothetical protein [Streptomyces sp. NPDC029554]|uniref:hypothetical protein n=1 Tax=Streptomyces sp. NPDC029554 TaxID=3155126 RepID=UPI0033CB15F1
MALRLFTRHPAPERPEAASEATARPETWTPEGVTVVQRYANQVGTLILLFSADDNRYYHVVACLGCHYMETTDLDNAYSGGLELKAAARVANAHAATCRALPRPIPTRPDDDTARDQLRRCVLNGQRRSQDVRIGVSFFDRNRLTLQRTNEWIINELQRLADAHPELVRTEHPSYSRRAEYYLRPSN